MMPDGNTAALRQYEAEQDRLARRVSTHGDRAMDSIVEAIMQGRAVARVTINDFIDEIDSDQLAAILIPLERDEQIAKLDALRGKIEAAVRSYFEDSDEYHERVRELDEPPCRCREDCRC